MKISIIIPVYNTEKYIYRCLISCLKEQDITPEEYEIIVVNDCTPDNSMSIVKDISNQYPQVRIIQMPCNSGQPAARNAGLNEAQGEYIFFLDSDDWIHPHVLQSMYTYASTHQLDLMPFGFILSHEFDDEKYCAVYNNSQEIMTGQSYCLTQKIFLLVPWAALYRREWMLENKLKFNEIIRYHEDEEFTPRAYFMAKRVSYFPGPCYEYRFKPSGTNSTSSKTYLRAHCYFTAAKSLYNFQQNYSMESDKARQYINTRIAYCIKMAISLSREKNLRKAIKESEFYPLKDLQLSNKLQDKIKLFILNHSMSAYYFISSLTQKIHF
ncbi:uncharacterized protein BN800_00632 [Bacteroides sp. CAG:875]|nr:uncharacterized protein BN800_00632 [Bacteroides sp. CAG:875]